MNEFDQERQAFPGFEEDASLDQQLRRLRWDHAEILPEDETRSFDANKLREIFKDFKDENP